MDSLDPAPVRPCAMLLGACALLLAGVSGLSASLYLVGLICGSLPLDGLALCAVVKLALAQLARIAGDVLLFEIYAGRPPSD